jgi:hypothetical protein
VRALVRWIAKFGDETVAILLTLTLFILGWSDVVQAPVINNVILLVLGVMTAGNLRDRFAARSMHQRVVAELAGASEIRILTGSQVTAELRAARHDTEFWHFRGGTGTYLRAVTLPECVHNARERRRGITVRIEVIDPTDLKVCARYASFRSSVPTYGPVTDVEPWTTERTRKEAYATILAAYWYRQRNDLLTVQVGLTTTMTTFRWDMSSAAVIQTQESAAGQALLFAHDKTYYQYWRMELERSFAQARPVPIGEADAVPVGDEPSVDEVTAVFDVLGVPLPREFGPREVSEIVVKALDAPNLFAVWEEPRLGGR